MSVSVLMYHHILPKDGFITSSIQNFKKQMEFLKANGYKTLTSQEFYEYKRGKLKVPKKSVLITFDDGWRDNFIYAYPILKALELKATMFVVTNWIEKASKYDSPYQELYHSECKKQLSVDIRSVICNWAELNQMRDLFDIHSHTHTHYDNLFDKIELNEEFTLSKELLKTRLGIDDTQLCWPRGIYDDASKNLALQNGFKILYTTKRGVNRADNKTYDIKRIAVKKDEKWLKKNLFIFSNNLLGSLYAKVKSQ